MIDQYFLVLTTIDLFVLTFMCILTKLSETLNSKQKRGFFLAFALIVFLAVETIIQIALPQLHVTWLCVTLLSVLYFIYCSEMWNQLDALTGLLNQNSYLNRTAEMRRSGEVLVVFDVDDFKQVNDRYGHVKGDICLAEIAACIKKAYARHGYCYRMGGDEFCVLLRDGDREHACARDFVRRLDERRKELDFLPTVSFGSAEISSENVVTVKDRADHNMYRYKKSAKPTVCQGTRARSNREEAGPWDRRNGARWSKASAQSADCPSYFRVTCRRDTRRPTARLIRWQKRFFSIRPCCKVRRSTRRCSILSTSCGTRSSTSIPSASTR